MDSKVCRDCKKQKPSSDFYKRKYGGDKYGLAYECKSCWLVKTKKYRDDNPEKIKQVNREQYLKNRDDRIIKQKDWSAKNKDKIIAAKKRRLESNPLYNRHSSIRQYGISVDRFYQMLKAQDNSCFICGLKFKKESEAKIDHCHNSDVVRGLLCSNCNTALGLVKENEKILFSMISYLNTNKDGWKEF